MGYFLVAQETYTRQAIIRHIGNIIKVSVSAKIPEDTPAKDFICGFTGIILLTS
jgi:hypothetical protein